MLGTQYGPVETDYSDCRGQFSDSRDPMIILSDSGDPNQVPITP